MKYFDKEERPWGCFYTISQEKEYKIKRIEVNTNSRLSYQYHNHRSEKWFIIKGKGLVTLESKEFKCLEGDIISIPKLKKHRIENIGKIKLIFVEIQTGSYFGEDDIIRLKDDYMRA